MVLIEHKKVATNLLVKVQQQLQRLVKKNGLRSDLHLIIENDVYPFRYNNFKFLIFKLLIQLIHITKYTSF